MHNGKMNLGRAGIANIGKAKPECVPLKTKLQVVAPRPAGFPANPTSEPIKGVGSNSQLRMKGMK